ncbi:MAG: hypothetical protein ABI639_11905 [Thermoanaerobaculia bacterium]
MSKKIEVLSLEVRAAGVDDQDYIPEFNPVEFDGIRTQAGLNSFSLNPTQWIDTKDAEDIIGLP